jgi:hypothetical protein
MSCYNILLRSTTPYCYHIALSGTAVPVSLKSSLLVDLSSHTITNQSNDITYPVSRAPGFRPSIPNPSSHPHPISTDMTAHTPGFSYPPASGTIAFFGCKDDSSDVTAGKLHSLFIFPIPYYSSYFSSFSNSTIVCEYEISPSILLYSCSDYMPVMYAALIVTPLHIICM